MLIFYDIVIVTLSLGADTENHAFDDLIEKGVMAKISKVNAASKKNIKVNLRDVDIVYTDDNDGKEWNAVRNKYWVWHTRDLAYSFKQGNKVQCEFSNLYLPRMGAFLYRK